MVSKKNKSKKEISTKNEYSFILWLLIGISLLFWGGYRNEFYNRNVYETVDNLLLNVDDNKLYDLYKDDNIFKNSLLEYDDEITFLNDKIDSLEDDSSEKKELVDKRDYYVGSRLREALNRSLGEYFKKIAIVEILIGSSICIFIFGLGFVLVKYRKYLVFKIISWVEFFTLLFYLIYSVLLGNDTFLAKIYNEFDANIYFVLFLVPIGLSYLNYVLKKEA